MMVDQKGMNLEETEQWALGLGLKPYRARQIRQWLFKGLVRSFDEMTNLPKDLRARLGEEAMLDPLEPVKTEESADGTRKFLFRLSDGHFIESVLIPERGHFTLCISSQAGCAMGCVFCATGQMGFKRHLSSGEIVAQVMYYARMLHEQGENVTNIVLMGMGEPFHNYDNVMAAVDRLNDSDGYNFGARRITISTVGLVPAIRRFANEKRQVNLAISMHAADDEERDRIMPVNRKHNIGKLLEACRYYVDQTGRRITFEWALISGVNDTEEVARKLATRLKGLMCHVNAIPLNPTTGYEGRATNRQSAAKFKETLEQAGIPCTIRMRRGIDIQAGCGQLAGSVDL